MREKREQGYRQGFEDALELCIAEAQKTENKKKALAKMYEFLGLVKEDKLERLKQMLFNITK